VLNITEIEFKEVAKATPPDVDGMLTPDPVTNPVPLLKDVIAGMFSRGGAPFIKHSSQTHLSQAHV
jgi:hypothetical protein